MSVLSRKSQPSIVNTRPMQYTAIENLLKKVIGLDPESIGSSSIIRVIRRCADESGFNNIHEYYDKLIRSEQELKKLIEAIIVPETWFFRDNRPFKVFGEYVRRNWFKNNTPKEGILRVLSIPCSTGEEPYSIAMMLDDMRYPASQFQIDAVDLSSKSIGHARYALYRENSFRGDEMGFRELYFTKEDKSYRLSKKICNMVNFYQGNILEESSLPVCGPYHVIFCRNLLIYFDRNDQRRAIDILYKLLASGGLLFIGHAEAGSAIDGRFTPTMNRGAFAYEKVNQNVSSQVVNVPRIKKKTNIKTQGKVVRISSAPVKKTGSNRKPLLDPKEFETISNVIDKESQLDVIRKLADEDKLQEAANLCEEFLSVHDDNAEVYYLLGVINEADGDDEYAVELFQKAVYLDANCHHALVHLALYAERRGDTVAATNYRRRAERAATRLKL